MRLRLANGDTVTATIGHTTTCTNCSAPIHRDQRAIPGPTGYRHAVADCRETGIKIFCQKLLRAR